MKSSKMLLLTTAIISMVGTISAVDYKLGEVDSHGRNLWHKLAERCADEDFKSYARTLEPEKKSERLGYKLLELMNTPDKKGEIPMAVAAEKLVKTYSPHCYEMVQMFYKAKEHEKNDQ